MKLTEHQKLLRAGGVRATISKDASVRIKQFICYGLPLDPFTTALVRLQAKEAHALAPPELHAEPQSVQNLLDWVEAYVPPNCFPTPEAITAWRAHQGLSGASENDRMWFFLTNSYWNPRRPPRVPKSIAVA